MITFREIYQQLYAAYGPQGWWPADSPFEVMLGAILTQNTSWSNVEKAIQALNINQLMSDQAILDLPDDKLAALIRPTGYFNVKAQRLKGFCRWYQVQGGYAELSQQDTVSLRENLLSIKGVGPETADDILLYAFARPVFVIDAYTRRLLQRLDLIKGDEGYEELRHLIEQGLGLDVGCFNEFHALIVFHAKQSCRVKPVCKTCLFYLAHNICPYPDVVL